MPPRKGAPQRCRRCHQYGHKSGSRKCQLSVVVGGGEGEGRQLTHAAAAAPSGTAGGNISSTPITSPSTTSAAVDEDRQRAARRMSLTTRQTPEEELDLIFNMLDDNVVESTNNVLLRQHQHQHHTAPPVLSSDRHPAQRREEQDGHHQPPRHAAHAATQPSRGGRRQSTARHTHGMAVDEGEDDANGWGADGDDVRDDHPLAESIAATTGSTFQKKWVDSTVQRIKDSIDVRSPLATRKKQALSLSSGQLFLIRPDHPLGGTKAATSSGLEIAAYCLKDFFFWNPEDLFPEELPEGVLPCPRCFSAEKRVISHEGLNPKVVCTEVNIPRPPLPASGIF